MFYTMGEILGMKTNMCSQQFKFNTMSTQILKLDTVNKDWARNRRGGERASKGHSAVYTILRM